MIKINVAYCDCKSVKFRSVKGKLSSRNSLSVTTTKNGETCDLCGYYVHWMSEITEVLDEDVIEFRRNGNSELFNESKSWLSSRN